jgi:hypothetical protein
MAVVMVALCVLTGVMAAPVCAQILAPTTGAISGVEW